jgi:RNA polymerase sporulation-specific sigma factor
MGSVFSRLKGDENMTTTAPHEADIEQHFPLVRYVLKKYGRYGEQDDLFQVGCIGLLKAIRGFNHELGYQFSTYAVPKIRGEINLYFRNNQPLKFPRSAIELATEIRRSDLMDEPVEVIAEILGKRTDQVSIALAFIQTDLLSLDANSKGKEDITVQDMLPVHDDQTACYIEEFLESLSERHQKVIALRIAGNTQRQIGDLVGFSQVQVMRIIASVGKKYALAERM